MATNTYQPITELKKKETNKQNRNMDTENIWLVVTWEGFREMGEKGEGIRKCNW